MDKTAWMVHVAIGMLGATAASAEESTGAKGVTESSRATSAAMQTLLAESPHAPRWQPGYSGRASSDPGRRSAAIGDIDFRDHSTLARLSRLRNLSLLTLAETSRTRLFLGVNTDGLAGLHFVAFRNHRDERFLTLARLPWLGQETPAPEIAASAPALARLR